MAFEQTKQFQLFTRNDININNLPIYTKDSKQPISKIIDYPDELSIIFKVKGRGNWSIKCGDKKYFAEDIQGTIKFIIFKNYDTQCLENKYHKIYGIDKPSIISKSIQKYHKYHNHNEYFCYDCPIVNFWFDLQWVDKFLKGKDPLFCFI